MATVLSNPKVGDLAYPAYSPQQAGVVVAVRPVIASSFPIVTIRMLNGREIETASPQDYRALVTEHRRKADAGETLIRSLEAMAAGTGGE
jgi:hypothetical protein